MADIGQGAKDTIATRTDRIRGILKEYESMLHAEFGAVPSSTQGQPKASTEGVLDSILSDLGESISILVDIVSYTKGYIINKLR